MLFNRISEICGRRGLSIARLEREAGLSNGTISRWGNPRIKSLKAVADVLGMSVDALIRGLEWM